MLVGVSDPHTAHPIAAVHAAVASAEAVADGLRLTFHRGVDADPAVHDLNRRLVEAGIGVHRLETERISLEDRFLQITSRLGETA
jgi:hypothetical protein